MLPSWRLSAVRWPTLLLAASIAFTGLGLFEATRAVRSQRAVAERALRDYAGFAAWSYQQHLRERLDEALHESLGAVNHGDDMHSNPRIPAARELAHYLPMDARCDCHRAWFGPPPLAFFGFRLGADTLGVAVNTHPDPDAGWEVDRPMPMAMAADHLLRPVPAGRFVGYEPADARWILDTVSRHVHGVREYGNFPLVVGRHDGRTRVLAYTLMPTTWGDTLVYGLEYDSVAFRTMLEKLMNDRGLIPAAFTRGHSAREVVRLQVSDATGHVLFATEPVRDWELDDTTRLAPTYGSLVIRAQIHPAMANSVVIGGLPRSRVPLFLGLFGVAVAMSLVALGQIRREGELARMRGSFVDSISHELRTPLAQMRVYLETLRLGRFATEEQRAWSIRNAERETRRLEHLVERVLRFSRTGRIGDDEVATPVDVTAETARIVDEFRPLAEARRARIETAIAPVPTVALRPNALRHVLLNLLDNAVKYGPTGQTVRVGVATVDGEVRLTVRDEGPGVPAAERDAVWRAYRRGGAAGHTAGSGIGLAVVHDVVAQHGGRAWIDDAPDGAGASVVVALPNGWPDAATR